MKILIWSVSLMLAFLWTGAAWAAALFVRWSGQALVSGSAEAAGRAAAAWPVPPWLSLWVDPAWLKAAQDTLRWSLDAAQSLLPGLGAAVGWLVPLVWVAWGFGLAMLVALAVLAHWGLARARAFAPRATTG